MGKTLVGKIVYFWIFLIGGMFISRMLGVMENGKDAIFITIVLGLIYWGLAFVSAGIKKRKG